MRFVVAIAILSVLTGCGNGRHSPAGFQLPETGDPERGKVAFVELNCHDCHPVNGVDLPAPAAGGGISLVLGGPVHEVRTDGYFVTSIIHPSHRVRRYPGGEGVEGSPMPDYTERMTVRQLIDLVAFLQSRYEIVPRPFVPY